MQKVLLTILSVSAASAVSIPKEPMLSSILTARPSQNNLKQSAFPIPDIPDDFEAKGRFLIYDKLSRSLKESNFTYLARLSVTLNSAMSQLLRTKLFGNETTVDTVVNYNTTNFKRGEETAYEFDYLFSKNSSCYAKNVTQGSLGLLMRDAWNDFQYLGVVTPTWDT